MRHPHQHCRGVEPLQGGNVQTGRQRRRQPTAGRRTEDVVTSVRCCGWRRAHGNHRGVGQTPLGFTADMGTGKGGNAENMGPPGRQPDTVTAVRGRVVVVFIFALYLT